MCSAYASLQWACASVGAILVTINPAYRLNELVCLHYFVNYLSVDMDYCDNLPGEHPETRRGCPPLPRSQHPHIMLHRNVLLKLPRPAELHPRSYSRACVAGPAQPSRR